MPDNEFYQTIIRQEQERARKAWAFASLGTAIIGFCAGLYVTGWHP